MAADGMMPGQVGEQTVWAGVKVIFRLLPGEDAVRQSLA
jgi:hypothetical protein